MSQESPRQRKPAAKPPALYRVLESVLYVSDVERARDWYRRVLGLREGAFAPPRHVFFRLGEGMLLLFNARETRREGQDTPPHGTSGDCHIAFEAHHDELPRWRHHLEVEGVAIEQEARWPRGGKSLYFRDPDGNLLELATRDTWE